MVITEKSEYVKKTEDFIKQRLYKKVKANIIIFQDRVKRLTNKLKLGISISKRRSQQTVKHVSPFC